MNELLNDPADFDVWAKVQSDASSAVAQWLADHLSISKADAYRAISPAVKSGKYIQLFTGYGWNSLLGLMAQLPEFVQTGTAVFAEQDCSPDYSVEYCEMHHLYHHLGRCPVCEGNYIHEGHSPRRAQ